MICLTVKGGRNSALYLLKKRYLYAIIGGDRSGRCVEKMKISYQGLFDILKDKGIMQKTMLNEIKLSSCVMQKIRKNESVTTDTLGKICEYLHCQPSDIMEVIYDTEVTSKQKQAIEAQIAEFQNKLKQI